MAEDRIADSSDPTAWRGRWISALALAAAIILLALLGLVALSNRNRDAALELERSIYESMYLARAADGTIARAEAALGRYVLDESRSTGTEYYQEWRRASHQIGQLRQMVRQDPAQVRRVDELRRLFNVRGEELARAAVASTRRQGLTGLGLFYSAAQSPTLPQLHAQLDAIEQAGRQTLQVRVRESQSLENWTSRLTQWLGWVAVLISALAIALSYWAYRAFAEGAEARYEADSEAERAAELDRAVQARTGELREANARLKAEAAEREAAEEKLRQIQKMEAVGQLTGGIAHDFNNMLAVVIGGVDLAKRKLGSSAQDVASHLDNAMEGATRAAALTRRLLAFARSEPLLPEGIDPARLLQNMLELVDRTIGERITIHTRFPEDPWYVWADPTGLENAVLNLCVNARDAMAETGDLTLAIENVRLKSGEVGPLEGGEYVRISVSDTGTGIAPEYVERVFEPFFTTKEVGKGTGLGLSQVFGMARQSGGHVTVTSELGQGTTVSIYLPHAVGEAAADESPRRSAATPARIADASRDGGRILVVEDDPRVSRSTVGALQELGHRPVAVASGPEALEVLEQEDRFDLIITDVVMPVMTGVELAREVEQLHPGMRVLFVTGYVGDAGTVDELAGHDLLRKPFTVAQLAAAVEAALPRTDYEAAAE